jgi:hypothetical protein
MAPLEPLFEAVKSQYRELFKGNEEITLSDRALAFIVSELSRYDFARNDLDAKGAAYQEYRRYQPARRPWAIFHAQRRHPAGGPDTGAQGAREDLWTRLAARVTSWSRR